MEKMTTTQCKLTGPEVSEPQGPAARGVVSRLPVSSSSGDGLACGLPTGPHAEAATVKATRGGGKKRRKVEKEIDVEDLGIEEESSEEEEDSEEKEEGNGKWPHPEKKGPNRNFILQRLRLVEESAREIEKAVERSKRMSRVEKDGIRMRKDEMRRLCEDMGRIKTRTKFLEKTVRSLLEIID